MLEWWEVTRYSRGERGPHGERVRTKLREGGSELCGHEGRTCVKCMCVTHLTGVVSVTGGEAVREKVAELRLGM